MRFVYAPKIFPHFVTIRPNQTKFTEHSEPQLHMQAVHDALAAQRRALEAIMQDSLTCWRDPLSIDQVRDFFEMVMTSWQEASTEDCLLYTSDAADDPYGVELGGRRFI